MNYNDLIQLYFERSNSLQAYWTLYVVVIGALLAFSSMRQKPDALSTLLVTILFGFFAFKNLGAIGDVSAQRMAALEAIRKLPAAESDPARGLIEATLNPPEFSGVRTFHYTTDVLVIAALWAMERRRRSKQ